MKTLLILYPIEPITRVLIGWPEMKEEKIETVRLYQKLMQERYKDFQRVYVFFSEPGNRRKPDLSQVSEGFSMNGQDIIGACGVAFENHCKNRVYPKGKDILKLCPEPIDELVVAGFHFWDCVNRVARYAWRKGVNVSVDEDLTEFFFFDARDRQGRPCLNIPISKEASVERRREQLRRAGPGYLEGARKARRNKPWMNSL